MKVKPTPNRGRVVVELKPGDEKLMAKSKPEVKEQLWPFPIKNILVPVDFSDYSKQALQYAVPLAEKLGAVVTLLHVVEPRIYPENLVLPLEAEDVNSRLMKDGQDMLESLRREELDADVTSVSMVTLGKPFQQIIDTAKSMHADLIIIATHGYTGLKHVLLGSTAERVVRHAPCPVLTVRMPEHKPA